MLDAIINITSRPGYDLKTLFETMTINFFHHTIQRLHRPGVWGLSSIWFVLGSLCLLFATPLTLALKQTIFVYMFIHYIFEARLLTSLTYEPVGLLVLTPPYILAFTLTQWLSAFHGLGFGLLVSAGLLFFLPLRLVALWSIPLVAGTLLRMPFLEQLNNSQGSIVGALVSMASTSLLMAPTTAFACHIEWTLPHFLFHSSFGILYRVVKLFKPTLSPLGVIKRLWPQGPVHRRWVILALICPFFPSKDLVFLYQSDRTLENFGFDAVTGAVIGLVASAIFSCKAYFYDSVKFW